MYIIYLSHSIVFFYKLRLLPFQFKNPLYISIEANKMYRTKAGNKRQMDENEAQKKVEVDTTRNGTKMEEFPHRAALAERKLNTQNVVQRLKKEEQEKKTLSNIRYGGDSCMVSVDDADDIDRYMRHIERQYEIPSDFLHAHPGVDGRMRQILVDWLIHVSTRFTFHNETLSLTVNMLDRSLLVMQNIDKSNLQLLGVSCLFAASKFEEIIVPATEDFVQVAANVFTKEDIFQMEQKILRALNFQLGQPHSIQFLRRYRFYLAPESIVYRLAKYICEVALLCYNLTHHPPSTIAAVALWLASYTLGHTIVSSQLFKDVFKLDMDTVITVARSFVDPMIQFAENNDRLYALYQKYKNDTLGALTDVRLYHLRDFMDFGLTSTMPSTTTTTNRPL